MSHKKRILERKEGDVNLIVVHGSEKRDPLWRENSWVELHSTIPVQFAIIHFYSLDF